MNMTMRIGVPPTRGGGRRRRFCFGSHEEARRQTRAGDDGPGYDYDVAIEVRCRLRAPTAPDVGPAMRTVKAVLHVTNDAW